MCAGSEACCEVKLNCRSKSADFAAFPDYVFLFLMAIIFDIGKKSVYACKTNYSSEIPKSDKISVYHFPNVETEKEKLIETT